MDHQDDGAESDFHDFHRRRLRLQQQHKGISSVEVSSAKTDSSLHCTNVFLLLCFGDSTKEEVCVPMVYKNGLFWMR